MKNMNITSPTAARIFAEWEKQGRSERPRTYLGASIVGHDCDAYLWLNFRGVVREKFDGRMYRLFDRGKREEAVFCDDLRRIGCEVKEFDENGGQLAVSALGGHFSGHLDGVVRGLTEAPKQWFVVEFKTHSSDSFKKLCKEGVAKAKPMHYAQMQSYMGHTGLKKALYMAVNKDNDELWIETIDFSECDFDAIMSRAKHIIDTTSPDRCAKRRDDFRCKACPCADICWHGAETFVDSSVPETCRTCCHATADTNHEGACWTCRLGHTCTLNDKCDDYLILPFFVSGDVADGDEYGIRYTFTANGKESDITIGKRGVSATEAKKFGPNEADGVKIIKEAVPGSEVKNGNVLKKKYTNENEFEVYFNGSSGKMMNWHSSLGEPFDMSKPIATEECSDATWFEYEDGWCLKVSSDRTVFTVYGENPPF